MALRADVPPQLIVLSPEGAPYYSGFNTEDAYRPLCRSHHAREGALRAAAYRSPAIAAGVIRDRLQMDHACAGGSCQVCQLLAEFDSVAKALVAAEATAIERRAALHPSIPTPKRGRVDVCDRGHKLIDPNLVTSDLRRGGRTCLACKRASDRARGKPAFPIAEVADRIYAQLTRS